MSKNRPRAPKATAPSKSKAPRGFQAPIPTPVPAPATKSHRGLKVGVEILAGLAAVAGIVAGTGYAIEKWNDTTAIVDFSGEIDQNKPFSIPLVVKNPSQIFAMHASRISCWADVSYETGQPSGLVLLQADQGAISVGTIPAGSSRNYPCDLPGTLVVHKGPTPEAPPYPVKQADMLVTTDYETWIPFTVSRHAVTHFVMFKTTSFAGLRANGLELALMFNGRQGLHRPGTMSDRSRSKPAIVGRKLCLDNLKRPPAALAGLTDAPAAPALRGAG
jgi:hypothetical protein